MSTNLADKVTVREYSPTVTEDCKEITCYIASEPGKVSAVQQACTQRNLTEIIIPREFYIEYGRNLNFGPPNTELSVDIYFG